MTPKLSAEAALSVPDDAVVTGRVDVAVGGTLRVFGHTLADFAFDVFHEEK